MHHKYTAYLSSLPITKHFSISRIFYGITRVIYKLPSSTFFYYRVHITSELKRGITRETYATDCRQENNHFNVFITEKRHMDRAWGEIEIVCGVSRVIGDIKFDWLRRIWIKTNRQVSWLDYFFRQVNTV